MEKFKVNKQDLLHLLLINAFIAINITSASYVHIPFGNVKALFI